MNLLTINFTTKEALYLQIYKKIKENILNNYYKPLEKLPSKRKLSLHLNVSINTVISAYNLLLAEGYIISTEKKGYYISNFTLIKTKDTFSKAQIEKKIEFTYDFTTKNIDTGCFPVYTWAKMAKDILYNNPEILNKSPNKGNLELRDCISKYLKEVKGITVSIDNIIIGSGIEFLLGILVKLIPSDNYAVENPGYQKISLILRNNAKKVSYIPIDDFGIRSNLLTQSDICYVTPANQFPTGKKMSIERKTDLINWSKQDNNRYIIEDDFDSDFRIYGNPPITLYSLNREKVIFISTFSRTIAPSLRVSYMVLPDILLKTYDTLYANYSNTSSTFEQLMITKFISEGYYSRHINKIKNLYRQKRQLIIAKLKDYPDLFSLNQEDSYLSIIVEIKKEINYKSFKQKLIDKSLDINFLFDYDFFQKPSNQLIIGYSQIPINNIITGLEILIELLL